jgi:tetratricopeptide (TPR) repeat protein
VPSMLARIKDFDFDYAEHRIYIPIIGIFIIIIEILKAVKIDFTKVKEIAAFAVIFLLFTVATIIYQSKFDGPLRFWGHFIKTYPHTTRGFIGVGKHYFVNKEYDKVEKLMKKGISVNPDFKYWYTNLSTIYLNQQKYTLAEENARKVLEFDKSDYQANLNLGYALGAQSKFKEAVPILEKAINLAKKPDKTLLKRLADAYFKAGYNDASIRAYSHYIASYPDDIPVYYELARVYSRLGMLEKGEELYKKLESFDKNSIQLYINWGTFYAENNNPEKAEEIWQKAYRIDPDNEQLLLNFIQLYSLMDKKDIALSYADKYEKLGKQLPPALKNLLNK